VQGGYCFVNNAAIAAQILSQNGKRVAIVVRPRSNRPGCKSQL
jgi:hypothetical protein